MFPMFITFAPIHMWKARAFEMCSPLGLQKAKGFGSIQQEIYSLISQAASRPWWDFFGDNQMSQKLEILRYGSLTNKTRYQ